MVYDLVNKIGKKCKKEEMREVFERVTERMLSEPELLMEQNAEDEFSGGFQIQENNNNNMGNFNNFESSFGNTSQNGAF